MPVTNVGASLAGRLLTSECICNRLLANHNRLSYQALHITPTQLKKTWTNQPSASNFKAKNIAFIKKWNAENLELFGPKIKVSKVKLKKNAKAADVTLDSPETEDIAEAEAVKLVLETEINSAEFTPPEQEKQTNSDEDEFTEPNPAKQVSTPAKELDQVEPIKKKSSPPKVKKPIVTKSNMPFRTKSPMPALSDLSELNGILGFPLLQPENDDEEASITDIPVLQGLAPPRVTRILDLTKSEQSQFVLNRWIQQQIAKLGKEGFGVAQKKRLRVASGLHGCVEQFLLGTPEHLLNIDEFIEPYWESIHGIITGVDDVLGVEISVEHEHLRYQGKADCIAQYKGEWCVIDWKTSSKPKPSLTDLFDYPLQSAAYMGALHFSSPDRVNEDMKKVNSMLLVISYEDGSPAHAHYIPPRQVAQYWRDWTRRLHKYWINMLSQQS